MLSHKTSLSKFKKIEIISSIFSDHSVMKPKINFKKKTGKFTNMGIFNNTPVCYCTHYKWIDEEIKGEIKKYLETNENGNHIKYLF